MKKIGREVLFLNTGENNPRNGEGTFLRLKNGAILFAYSRFSGKSWDDADSADIASLTSYDEGETWVESKILFEHDEKSKNYMAPTLLRMNNGDVGIVFLRKENESCIPYFSRSNDEGETFTMPEAVIDDNISYFVLENDHAIILKNGRIILPANYHSIEIDGVMQIGEHAVKCIFASDDDGKTWEEIATRQDIPFSDKSETGLQETCVYQLKSGRLRAFSRTDLGFQFECFSDDNGCTWSEPSPNRFFSSPDSPLLMKRAGRYTIAIFNPIPIYTTLNDDKTWGRTPLICAVSEDDGNTFTKIFALEDDPDNGFCYPALIEGEDYFLVSYYHSNNTGIPLNSTKVIKIMFSEIE